MTSGGYSEHYRHILLHHDQVDRHDEEVAAGRPGAVLERNKKLSAETNKRRKQLEERWRQHEEAEERRRAEVLLARKARLRAATEKYQKSGLPQTTRPPASARLQQRSRSSSLPFQLDGSSPRRAGSALDAATAIERALQAIRAEIQPTLRRAQPPSPPAPPTGSGEGGHQHRLFSTAYGGANLGSNSARHGGSWGNVAGVGDGRLGSHAGNSSATATTHHAGGAGAAARDPAASGPDRKMMATTWDGAAAAGQYHSGVGGGNSGNSSSGHLLGSAVRDSYDKETPVRWASAAGQQRDWDGTAGASGIHLQNGSVSQQHQQQHDRGRSADNVASLSTVAAGRQATTGGLRNEDGGGNERFALRVGSGSGSRNLAYADSVDLARASVDSLDEEMPDQMTPRPATGSLIAASSVGGQRTRNLSSGANDDGKTGTVTAAASAAAAAKASGPSRGFSTWRAAEEVANERSQNPHLRDSPDAAVAAADEPHRRNAIAVEGDAGSRLSTAQTASAAASGASNGYYRPLSQQQQQRRDLAVGGEVSSLTEAPDELVQWQAVPSPPWGRHPSAMQRRLSARTTATPLAAPSSLQSANSVSSSAAVGGAVGASWVLADQQRAHDARSNMGDRTTAASQQQLQQPPLQGGVHGGFAAGSGSPNARTAAAASTSSRTADEPTAGVAGAAPAAGTSAAVRLSSGRVLTVHSLAARSPSATSAVTQPLKHSSSPGMTEYAPSSAWIPATAGTASAATAAAVAAAEDSDGLWRSRPPLAVRPPGPGRPPQATAYGVTQQFDRTAAVGNGESVQPTSYAEAVAAAAAAFDSGSVYSDSTPSLSGRGSSVGAVKGILKRSAAVGSARGGGSSDNGSGSVHSALADRGDLASSKLRSLSSPNIRDSLDVARKRNDNCPKPQTPRKKSVRFADSDSEAEEAETESSAAANRSNSEKSSATACWISPAHVLDIQELQSLVAPMPQSQASTTVSQRPISASAAAQKPPAPPPSSARAQRAASASMAAAARRRGIPVAVRPPAVQRRWSADGDSGHGQDSSAAPANTAIKDAAGSSKSATTAADDVTGVPLGRTPTDEEINNLWHTVRTCLRAGQDASGAADVPAVDGAAQSTPAVPPGSQARSPSQQAAPVTKITADSLSRLGRTVNGYGHYSGAASPGAALLQLRGRAASDPALAVVLPQPQEQQQQNRQQQHLQQEQRQQQHLQQEQRQQQQQLVQTGVGDVAWMSERAFAPSTQSSAYGRGPTSAHNYNGVQAGKDGAANGGGWKESGGYGSVALGRQNGSVSSSMAAFLAAEELSARPLVSESQISHAVREVEHFHRPAGMHPVPSRVAHFRRGSAGKAVAGVPMSALSLEEQKLLRSLEVLNERLKITEAANATAMGGTPSAAAVVPARR